MLVLALTGLMYTTLREDTQYYKHVDEVMADPAAWHGKRLQLHGYVEEHRAQSATRSSTASRSRATATSSRPATPGVVPDTFKGGSEVVLKGTLEPARASRSSRTA